MCQLERWSDLSRRASALVYWSKTECESCEEEVYTDMESVVNNARSVSAAQFRRECFAPAQTKLHNRSHVSLSCFIRARGAMISKHSKSRFFEVLKCMIRTEPRPCSMEAMLDLLQR